MEGKNYAGMLTIDVKNAFNSAHWGRILESVSKKSIPPYLCNIIESNFKDRQLSYSTGVAEETIRLTSGVPQGSVLGPTMWNLLYDGLLRETMPTGVEVLAFADDLALVATASICCRTTIKGSYCGFKR